MRQCQRREVVNLRPQRVHDALRAIIVVVVVVRQAEAREVLVEGNFRARREVRGEEPEREDRAALGRPVSRAAVPQSRVQRVRSAAAPPDRRQWLLSPLLEPLSAAQELTRLVEGDVDRHDAPVRAVEVLFEVDVRVPLLLLRAGLYDETARRHELEAARVEVVERRHESALDDAAPARRPHQPRDGVAHVRGHERPTAGIPHDFGVTARVEDALAQVVAGLVVQQLVVAHGNAGTVRVTDVHHLLAVDRHAAHRDLRRSVDAPALVRQPRRRLCFLWPRRGGPPLLHRRRVRRGAGRARRGSCGSCCFRFTHQGCPARCHCSALAGAQRAVFFSFTKRAVWLRVRCLAARSVCRLSHIESILVGI